MMTLAVGLILAQQPDLDRVQELQKQVHAVCDKVRPAFVFIGGGSGVCISADGFIITNHHVAGEREHWSLVFSGGRKAEADVVGFDPLGDLCLLKVKEGKDLPFAEFGDSDALRVGERVIAVGNPFMLGENHEPTITMGIVSALHRYQDWYMDAIQTDAQINPGNSGGPLFTMEGRIAGINGRIEVKRFMNRVNTGIGYAIPANQIRRYLPLLKSGGRIRHGFLAGVTLGECGDNRYENVGEYGDGVFLAGVAEGMPPDRAGLKEGDILSEIEGLRCTNLNRFHGIVGTFPPGSSVRIKGRRLEGKEWKPFEALVVLGDPEELLKRDRLVGKYDLGFIPGMSAAGDVPVDDLAEDGAAAKAGLKIGDAIRRIDGVAVKGWEGLRQELGRRTVGETVKLTVLREGKEIEIALPLAERGAEEGEPKE